MTIGRDAAPGPDEGPLTEALGEAQRLGLLGRRPIGEVIEHARAFVAALDGVTGEVVDLGSGGGVPGLVIAVDRPDLRILLVERREKRSDFLERAVRRLSLGDRVQVCRDDVRRLVSRRAGHFDAVVARGFGPPEVTLRWAVRLLAAGGRVIISEPPESDRWPANVLADQGVSLERRGPVAIFHRS